MARMTFEQANNYQSNNNPNFVGFFSLKNDGDEAIVRFMHDDVSTFDILSVHPVTIDGRYRSVSCLRDDPREPLDRCPLCQGNVSSRNAIYIHMIQYNSDENGNIVPSLKVWERSLSYATKLRDLIIEYGPLTNSVFKIRRSGKPGSRETNYSIMYANPNIYSPDRYPIPEGAFENYSALGTCVMNKTADDMMVYLNTGNFPAKQNTNNDLNESIPTGGYTPAVPQQYAPPVQQAPQQPPVNYAPPQQQYAPPVQQYNAPSQVNTPPVQNNMPPMGGYTPNVPNAADRTAPWMETPAVDKPKRYYQ